MKKRLLPITILASLGVAALAGCGGGSGGGGGGGSTVDVTGVTLNKTSLELYPEGSEKLVATVAPADATDKSVTWKSGDTRICTVDAEGLVTAVAVGTAKVTVTTVDGGYKAECNVTVKLNMNSITITNKADFADGMEAGANKAVSVTGDPTINATDLANKGLLTIESSNKAVATTNKLMVYAVGAGTTTITATLFGKTDSFELTVSAKQTNKEKYGTTHEGDAADPFDNEDAIKVTKALKTAGETGDDYYVKGEVASFYHAPGARDDGAVSWFLKPATEGGEKFEIYKCYKEGTGEASYLTDNDVWVNGTTVAHGKFTTYNDQCETSSAIFVSCEGNKPEPRKTVTKTFAEALSTVKALEDGADTYDYYQVDAYVTKKSGDNYFLTATKAEAITDEKANTIELYNVTDADAVAKLTKNAKVTIVMVLKNYHEQVENLFAVAADQITVVEAGGTWDVVPEPAVADKTLAEFIALPDSKALAYNVSAEIKAFKSGDTKDQYGNMTLTDGTNDLTIYGSSATATALAWNDADAYAFVNPKDFMTNATTSALNVGDTVKMKLIRADYKGAVQGTGIIIDVTPGGGGGGGQEVPEPAVADKTLAEFIALADSKALAYNVSAEVKSFKNGSQTADKYGNMVLTDGTNDLVIYGASATATALAWNKVDAYSFSNPQDFLTNGTTSAIKVGDTVKMKLIRADYQGTVQGTGIVLEVTPGEGGGGGEQEVAAYKLDGTQTGGTNGYATESDIAQGGVNWKVTGNTTQNPWRIGGKSLDGVDRDIYSVNALEYDINKVVVKLGSSSLTVNSIKLMVGSTSGANDVREATNTGPLAANAVVEFVRPEGDSWIGKYFKIAINVTVEGNDNKYVQLLSVEFFGEAVA